LQLNNILPKIVVILGPTAAGKSNLAYELAKEMGFEIVNADSLQIYKHLNIGTAKPDKHILSKVPHHLIDTIDPDCDFNAGKYRSLAQSTISRLYKSSKKVLLVGGTYLYVKVLLDGLIEDLQPDAEFRDNLKKEKYLFGNDHIFEKLRKIDPESAKKIEPNDYIRVERALEVYFLTGNKMSDLQTRHAFKKREYDVLKIGLRIDKKLLIQSIENRLNSMLDKGLIDESRDLIGKGYKNQLKPLQSIGYKEIFDYLDGFIDLEKAKKLILRNTRRLAKRQMTWLNKDKEIIWYDFPYDRIKIKDEIKDFYNN